MERLIKPISIDCQNQNRFKTVITKQGDVASRYLLVTLTCNNVPINIDNDDIVTISCTRADGQSKSFEGENNKNGTATVPLPNWLLECSGNALCEIVIYDKEKNLKLSSLSFSLFIEPNINVTGISEDEQSDFVLELLNKLDNCVKSCSNADAGINSIMTILSDGNLKGIEVIKTEADIKNFCAKLVTNNDDGDEIANFSENEYYIAIILSDIGGYVEKGIVIYYILDGDIAEVYLTPNAEKFSEYVKVSDMNSAFENIKWKQLFSQTTDKDIVLILKELERDKYSEVLVAVTSKPSSNATESRDTNVCIETDSKALFNEKSLVIPQAYSIYNNEAEETNYYHFRSLGCRIKCDAYYLTADSQPVLADTKIYKGNIIQSICIIYSGRQGDSSLYIGAGSQIEIWGKENV